MPLERLHQPRAEQIARDFAGHDTNTYRSLGTIHVSKYIYCRLNE
jgi:hypothetical protein